MAIGIGCTKSAAIALFEGSISESNLYNIQHLIDDRYHIFGDDENRVFANYFVIDPLGDNYRFNLNATGAEGNTLLIIASLNGHLDAVNALIAAGADVNVQNNAGHTALFKAAVYGHSELVNALIAADADVNAITANHSTALMKAAAGGYLDTVRALIAAGADVNAQNNAGQTALFKASEWGHLEVSTSAQTLVIQVNFLLLQVNDYKRVLCNNESQAFEWMCLVAALVAAEAV